MNENLLKMRASRVRNYHKASVRSAKDHLGYAFLCGLELNAAKEALPHGHFMKWADKALPEVSPRAQARYRDLAEGMLKIATVANLAGRLLAEGKPNTGEKRVILDAVHKLADGKTVTDFYRELGVIRPPEKPKHHAATLSALEKVEADARQAEEILRGAITALNLLADRNGELLGRVADQSRAALLEAWIPVGKLLKPSK